MSRIRVQKIEKELLRLISNVINYKLRDKYLDFVTITRVRVSNDLSYVKVYYTHLHDSELDKVQEALVKSTGFIKHELAAAKFLRLIPNITFYHDSLEEQAKKIDRIFDKIASEKETE